MTAQPFEGTSERPSIERIDNRDIGFDQNFFDIPASTIPVSGLAEYLVGTWKARRELADHRRHVRGYFLGDVVFGDRLPRQLSYFERGIFSMGTYNDESTRALELHLLDDGGADVHFTDGRYFHHLDLRDGFCRVSHVCGNDHYVGLFAAVNAQHLDIRWRIGGPGKDLDSNTTLRRARNAESARPSSTSP